MKVNVLRGERLVASSWLLNSLTQRDKDDIDAYRTAVGASNSNWLLNRDPRAQALIESLRKPTKFGGGG